jgi:H+/Cl- antiporter ClcA
LAAAPGFWGGALVVGTISVLFTKAANWAQTAFQYGSAHIWGLPLVLTPAGFVLCAWESGRFLKKAAQKLSLNLASGDETSTAQTNKVFLLLFVHKK